MDQLSHIHPELRGLAVEVSKLTPDPKNARKHDRRNLDAIKASLVKFGMRQPIVVQRAGDELIVRAGNGRLQVAKELGWSHLPAVVFDENDTDAVAYAIADNRTAELAEWDWESFGDLLKEHDSMQNDLVSLGWQDQELAQLLEGDIHPVHPPAKPERHIDRDARVSTRTAVDVDSIEEYDEATDFYVVKILNVPPADKAAVVDVLNAALTGAGYALKAVAY